MAKTVHEVQAIFSAKDETKGAVASVQKSMKDLDKGNAGLAASAGKVAAAYLSFRTVEAAAKFMIEGAQAARMDAQAMLLLNNQINKLEGSYATHNVQAQEFIGSMKQIGQDDADTVSGLTRLVRITGNLEDAMKLSALASNLSASGMGTYSETVDDVTKILAGQGIRTLKQYGVVMDQNATIAEQLTAVYGVVSMTQEQLAKTTHGQLTIMANSFSDLKKEVGKLGLFFAGEFAASFNGTLENMAINAGSWSKSVAVSLGSVVSGWQRGTALMDEFKSRIDPKKDPLRAIGADIISPFASLGGAVSGFFGIGDFGESVQLDQMNKVEKAWKAMNNPLPSLGGGGGSGGLDSSLLKLADRMEDLTETAKETKDKTVDAFKELAKSVVDSVREQEKAIIDLKQSISDTSDSMMQDITNAKNKFRESVVDIARASEENIKDLDKQIAEERSRMTAGWRGRIDELVAKRKEEQDILKRASVDVKDIGEETKKDALTLLKEQHEAELEEIKLQAGKRNAEYAKEMDERATFLKDINSRINSPGFVEGAIAESQSFLGQIGAAPGSNQFVFNITAGAIGDEGLQQVIRDAIATLDRTATLRGFAGT